MVGYSKPKFTDIVRRASLVQNFSIPSYSPVGTLDVSSNQTVNGSKPTKFEELKKLIGIANVTHFNPGNSANSRLEVPAKKPQTTKNSSFKDPIIIICGLFLIVVLLWVVISALKRKSPTNLKRMLNEMPQLKSARDAYRYK